MRSTRDAGRAPTARPDVHDRGAASPARRAARVERRAGLPRLRQGVSLRPRGRHLPAVCARDASEGERQMSIADQPYFPGFPQFNPKDFAEFMLFVYAELEN